MSTSGEPVRPPMAYSGSMLPAPDICRRARLARDLRFDGHFVVGVVTTGVFCRPICPARLPAEENVRYFATSAPRWMRATGPACAAILSGTPITCLDDRQRDGRARSAHDRQRLSCRAPGPRTRGRARCRRTAPESHFSARKIGTTRRDSRAMRRVAPWAKRLVDETHLAMADVAYAAGYGSVSPIQRRVSPGVPTPSARDASQARTRRRVPDSPAPAYARTVQRRLGVFVPGPAGASDSGGRTGPYIPTTGWR